MRHGKSGAATVRPLFNDDAEVVELADDGFEIAAYFGAALGAAEEDSATAITRPYDHAPAGIAATAVSRSERRNSNCWRRAAAGRSSVPCPTGLGLASARIMRSEMVSAPTAERDLPTGRDREYQCRGSWWAAESGQAAHAPDRAPLPPHAPDVRRRQRLFRPTPARSSRWQATRTRAGSRASNSIRLQKAHAESRD